MEPVAAIYLYCQSKEASKRCSPERQPRYHFYGPHTQWYPLTQTRIIIPSSSTAGNTRTQPQTQERAPTRGRDKGDFLPNSRRLFPWPWLPAARYPALDEIQLLPLVERESGGRGVPTTEWWHLEVVCPGSLDGLRGRA